MIGEERPVSRSEFEALRVLVLQMQGNGLDVTRDANIFAGAAANQGTSKQGARSDHKLASHGDTLPAATITQAYATAAATHAALTSAAVLETAATQTTPWGYATAAQADSIPASLNDLRDDLTNLKQVVNTLIDVGQTLGELG